MERFEKFFAPKRHEKQTLTCFAIHMKIGAENEENKVKLKYTFYSPFGINILQRLVMV